MNVQSDSAELFLDKMHFLWAHFNILFEEESSLLLKHVCVTTYSRLQIFERLSEDDVEDGVRSTALLVHVGGSNGPGLIAL